MGVRELLMKRSDGCCEAVIQLPRAWVRCGKRPVEDHHLLTRARGGDLLDEVGEIHHHLALCHEHHVAAHSPNAREAGLLMDGYVYRDAAHGLVYSGPDVYLSDKYGHERDEAGSLEMQVLPEAVRGTESGQEPREEVRTEL